MFVFVYIDIYVGYMCVSVYMCPYICLYMHACVCLCVHTLPPASILFGFTEAVIEATTMGPKSLCGSSWISEAWYYLVKSSCQRDMNVWLLWTENKKTISSCVTTKTTNIAENVISTRTLLHLDLGWGEEGHSEHVFGICKPFVRWKTRHSWKACQPLLEQRRSVELLVTGRFHCGSIKRGPPSESAIRRG